MTSKYILLIALSHFCCAALFAQSIIDASRISGNITLDGQLNEPEWKTISPLTYRMQVPEFDKAPSEQSEVFLAYDDEYIYLGGIFHLSDPSYLRPTTYKRDAMDGTTDYFGIIIDSYLDKENAVAFFTNANSIRWDGTIWNDAQGEAPMSLDWNTFWDVKSTYDEKGWSTEMRIPWSSLRFQDKDGEVIMGIISWWYIAAKNEVDIFPLIPLNWGEMSGWKPSQTQEFRFRGIKRKNPLYLAPYILGGFQQNFELNESELAYEKKDDPTFEVGLDLKYGITSNLTMDLTINTDFAQVEADDQQVNLTRFNLFFPEKRLFFLERASIFDFNFDNFNRLFYSRTIGINEDDGQVQIYGGARLVGRLGKFDVGFLDMQTASSENSPSENFGLLRIRRQINNNNSYIGGIFTNRTNWDGQYNTTYGVDGILKIVGDDYLTLKWAQSFEQEKENHLYSLDPSRIYLNWERRRYDGLSYNLTYSRAGEDYKPGVGFELRENYSSIAPNLAYGWLMGDQSNILRIQTFLRGLWVQSNDTKKLQTATGTAGLQIETKDGWAFIATALQNQEYLSEPFELSEQVSIPIGDFSFFQFQGTIATPFQRLWGTIGEVTIGKFYDGNIRSLGFSPRLKLSPHLDLEGFYQYNVAEFKARQQTFKAHLGRLKLLYMLNTQFSIASFLQYNSLDQVYAGNIRLRFNPKEGNDLFIVYNDLLNHRRKREQPFLPLSSSRAIVLKYTYTLQR
ncbi:MAG: DUF5916 domain-containing protein [Saprospiraceae bacterium]